MLYTTTLSSAGALAEPVYGGGLPGETLHFFDPLIGYTTPQSLEGANANRVGGAWNLRGGFLSPNGGTFRNDLDPDPYHGGGAIEFNHPEAGVAIQDAGVTIPPGSLLNGSAGINVYIVEFSLMSFASQTNTGLWSTAFQSKLLDIHGTTGQGPPTLERFDWLTDNQTFQLGGEDAPSNGCQLDQLCSRYYSDTAGSVRRAQFGDTIPPRSGHTPPSGPPYRFAHSRQMQQLFQTNPTLYRTVDDFRYNQNMNWGLTASRWDHNGNWDFAGNSPVASGRRLRIKVRMTMGPGNDAAGDGRLEWWVGLDDVFTAGTMLKIVQYVGDLTPPSDVFPQDPGIVYMGDRARNFFEAQIGFCWPQRSGIVPSGQNMGARLGYVRVWSHDYLPLS